MYVIRDVKLSEFKKINTLLNIKDAHAANCGILWLLSKASVMEQNNVDLLHRARTNKKQTHGNTNERLIFFTF